jgi:hypothetical protein
MGGTCDKRREVSTEHVCIMGFLDLSDIMEGDVTEVR